LPSSCFLCFLHPFLCISLINLIFLELSIKPRNGGDEGEVGYQFNFVPRTGQDAHVEMECIQQQPQQLQQQRRRRRHKKGCKVLAPSQRSALAALLKKRLHPVVLDNDRRSMLSILRDMKGSEDKRYGETDKSLGLLHSACLLGDSKDTVSCLLLNGCDPNQVVNISEQTAVGLTPLHLAFLGQGKEWKKVRHFIVNFFRLLIQSRVQFQIVEELLLFKADPQSKSFNGGSFFNWASSETDMKALLKSDQGSR